MSRSIDRQEKSRISLFYESKFKEDKYGGKAVFLNSDTEHYHQEILRILRKKGKGKALRILDVGCATGYLGAEAKRLGHSVYGIELSETAASKAREVLDTVICGDIMSIELPWDIKFDVLILSDILEHLFDPKHVLLRLKEFVDQDGSALAVLPNVAHYSLRWMLLTGRWEYRDHGPMDYGHLRFYSRNSATNLFQEAGYQITQIIPWLVFPFPFNIIDKKCKRLLSKLVKIFCLDTLFAMAYLYVIRPER